MKSAKIFVLFILLPIATVETGFFDFINVFFDKEDIDGLRPFDAKAFEEDLRKSLYWQHIALETILKAVSWFMKDPNPPKPLVLFIHGPIGLEKTYVSKIIARHIYKMGEMSKHVHTFIASYHFPNKQHTEMYETQLKQWIHGNVSSFPHSMFIFDEVEKMDSHLIETIKPFLDYLPNVDGVSFHNAIFVFISQTGGKVNNQLAPDYWRKGEETEELHINKKGMDNQAHDILSDKSSGFWHSCLMENHLVDHFIPVLPLKLKDDKDNLRPFDAKEFMNDLRMSLYGQHIALETIQKSVSRFMKDSNPPKPLVLSIHGPTGVGKTYVTKIIAKNIYVMGEKSKHVHTFIASYHFPLKQHTEIYETQLKQWIHGNVSSFPLSMFIFKEVEKMNPHLIETIKPFLDYLPYADGVSFHNAIFVFISNAGQDVINNITLDLMREGTKREDIQMNSKDMETKIYQYIFNKENTGFRHSCLIDEHLVDHFIPFLPLELKHVRQCILAEMVNLNIPIAQYSDLVDTVARQMPFFPPEEKIFSVKGCKSVRQKLILSYKK